MHTGGALHDGQSQPRSLGRSTATRGFAPHEGLPQPVGIGRRNAGAVVFHLDPAAGGVPTGAQDDGWLAVAPGVFEQVEDGTPQQPGAGLEAGVREGALLYLHGLALGGAGVGHLARQGVDGHGGERLVFVGAGKVEELADDGIHFGDAALHAGGQLGACGLAQDFDAEAQLGERGAQVVGDACQHEGALPIGLSQAAGHVVEAGGQGGDFARALHRQGGRIMPLRHLPRGAGQVGQGAMQVPLDEQGPDERQQGTGQGGGQPGAREGLHRQHARQHDPVVDAVERDAQRQRAARLAPPDDVCPLHGKMPGDGTHHEPLQRGELGPGGICLARGHRHGYRRLLGIEPGDKGGTLLGRQAHQTAAQTVDGVRQPCSNLVEPRLEQQLAHEQAAHDLPEHDKGHDEQQVAAQQGAGQEAHARVSGASAPSGTNM